MKAADVLEEYMSPYSGGSSSEARMQHEAVVIRAKFWFLTLGSRRWRWYVPPRHWLTYSRLHGVITQKTESSFEIWLSLEPN
jgi:hypothetical protein